MHISELLVIICKYPAPGNSKTRLGAKIGNETAAVISQSLLLDVVENHRNQKYSLVVVASERERKFEDDFKKLLPDVPVHFIKGNNLRGVNSHIWEIFSEYLKQFEKVVVLYSDTPFVDSELIKYVFQNLTNHDVVIGPDTSSGYFLIGLKKPYDLFTTLPADRGSYRPETLQLIRQYELDFMLLEPYVDIDELEDIYKIDWQLNKNWRRTHNAIVKLGLIKD
ncbi:MAG: DUF2064 domain-containing protein [Leptospiraceae bacterium]|nr:DUF2064 domain-containing protein [Leptospiraceae bacterium]